MSKKGKLILATALFGAALFGASCGGGGGTASAPPPPPAPSASDVAKVLVLAAKGITSAGATVGLFEGTVKSDGTVSWSSDLLPGENVLDYYHEFSNRSVLLYDINDDSVHLYTGTLNPVTTGVDVVYDTITPITITSGLAFFSPYHIFLPNFVVMDDGTSGGNVDYIITSNGRIVEMPGTTEHLLYAGRDYLVVGNGTATSEHVYIVKRDGSVEILDWNDALAGIQPINGGQVRFLDRVQGTDIILLGHTSGSANAIYVILEDGTPVRITNSTNASTGDDPVANISSGKIMRDANGNIFVAINYEDSAGRNSIQYFKIIPSGSGSVVFTPLTPINLGTTTDNPLRRGGYALDGNGRLYAITFAASNFNITTRFIDASNSLVTGPTHALGFSGTPLPVMLAFANGVLVSNNPSSPTALSHVRGIDAPTNIALSTALINAVSLCNRVNDTSELILENNPAYSGIVQEPVVGEGTNRLMCASAAVSALRNRFAWVQADVSVPGTYDGNIVSDVNGPSLPGTSFYLMATANSMIFVYDTSFSADQTFQECTFGATSCATRNLTNPVYWRVYNSWDASNSLVVTTLDKIKSDNNVLSDGAGSNYLGYWQGVAPNIRAVYFTITPSAPYIANIQTGAVDTSTLNVVFSNAPARGGNISLELDKAANVRRPITGAQCPSGLFDFVWYKDATYNFDNLTRPAGTCLIRVLQVRTP